MTIRIPKWLLWAVLGVVLIGGVGIGAYLLGKSSDEDEPTVLADDGATSEVDPSDGEPVESEPSTVPPPDCTKAAVKEAVVDTEFEASVRELGAVQSDEPLFGGFGYVVVEVSCRDLTGDGAEEMVAQLGCCTGGSPSPWAILVAANGAWELAFYRTGIQGSLSVEGDAIVEKSPSYAAGDPTCCPTTFRFGRVSWDGSEFVFESDEAPGSRSIKAGPQGVTRLGEFRPETDSPLEAAEAFGPPSYVGPDDELCVNEWRDLGLLINFADLGGADPCSAEGRVGSIELKDEFAAQAGWETDEGVRVGMSLQELRQIYPDAENQSFPGLGKVLVLIEGPTTFGEGGTYPVLSARIGDGAVDELRLSVGAAGE